MVAKFFLALGTLSPRSSRVGSQVAHAPLVVGYVTRQAVHVTQAAAGGAGCPRGRVRSTQRPQGTTVHTPHRARGSTQKMTDYSARIILIQFNKRPVYLYRCKLQIVKVRASKCKTRNEIRVDSLVARPRPVRKRYLLSRRRLRWGQEWPSGASCMVESLGIDLLCEDLQLLLETGKLL